MNYGEHDATGCTGAWETHGIDRRCSDCGMWMTSQGKIAKLEVPIETDLPQGTLARALNIDRGRIPDPTECPPDLDTMHSYPDPTDPEHSKGSNAEDCPGCAGTNPPYPFICPGDDRNVPDPTDPEHYKGKGMEVWDVVDAFGLDYYEGQVLKYLLRWRKKGGVKDLEKAEVYLNRIIEREEKTQGE